MEKDWYKDILLGVAVGDALGVPVEFRDREEVALDPVTEMRGYGTHEKPPGTFSDDSSLTFCLAEALTRPFQLDDLAESFIHWLDRGYWTADGHVFDVGIATSSAIRKLKNGVEPELAGGHTVEDNGNGSLMRILPLLTLTKDLPEDSRFDLVRKVSSITHRHTRSVMACYYYLEFALGILRGEDKFNVYKRLQLELKRFWLAKGIDAIEIRHFDRLLNEQIAILKDKEIRSSGYVMHTLEASIWCILTTECYAEATLKAVNLGLDTDTTAAVTGGLAAVLYGYKSIPAEWLAVLTRAGDIEDLAGRLKCYIEQNGSVHQR